MLVDEGSARVVVEPDHPPSCQPPPQDTGGFWSSPIRKNFFCGVKEMLLPGWMQSFELCSLQCWNENFYNDQSGIFQEKIIESIWYLVRISDIPVVLSTILEGQLSRCLGCESLPHSQVLTVSNLICCVKYQTFESASIQFTKCKGGPERRVVAGHNMRYWLFFVMKGLRWQYHELKAFENTPREM